MKRVFHDLTVRTLSDEQRLLEGWATTNRIDRVGDIVEPLGAEFDLPIPLLLDHDYRSAVGEIELAEVTSKGIRFQARIKKIDEPGRAKDLTDEAFHLAKYGLRKCVSVGFQPIEWEPLADGGMRFTRWSWYELSMVSVPANQDAVIETVKRAPHSGRGHVVKLTDREIRRGKVVADADWRFDRKKRLGNYRDHVVRLDGSEYVDRVLAKDRARRRAKERRARLNGAVRIR